MILPTLMLLTLAADQTVYVGTRTSTGRAKGVYRMQFNPATGDLSNPQLAAETTDPSFIAVHNTRPLLFAVVASPEGQLKSFSRSADGSLTLLNAVSTKGAGPAHVQIDRSGQWVASANYGSGSASIHRIEADGRLSEATDFVQHTGSSVNEARQKGPHAHSANFSFDNKFLYIADLGLDEVKVYAFDSKLGKLTPQPSLLTPKGAGPRHLALGKKRIYVLNEITSSVSVFEKGKLLETVSTLPTGFTGPTTCAEVLIDAKEKFLYASNRGADTISVFRIGKTLTKIADTKVGKVPRGFVFSPDYRFLIVGAQDDDLVQSYRVDPTTGLLTPSGTTVKIGSPISFRFAK